MRDPILSAGVVPIRFFGEEPRLLILRAYRNWDFPKGAVEPGETPLEAARREVREETGLNRLAFRWGEEYRETSPYRRGKVARYYLAETRDEVPYLPVNPALGRPEHHELRWATPTEAMRLLPERLQPVLRWALARIGKPRETGH
jgi:8-oxo-dGTP pyrophosphatase MutT (NUDIX family)